MALTCPSCGNDQNFLVKTLQMHIVQLRDSRVEANEEGRPAVIEVLCDECETALNFAAFEEEIRNEVLLTPGPPQTPLPSRLFSLFEIIAFGADPLPDLPGAAVRVLDVPDAEPHSLA